ncbi:GNAT family N-acetyltransferase [Mycoplasma sp. P36-A1]|uniref:GNAT family N-acetyltransferase n=1 Tax=Mycoplasma sp. P36-A1 TaxID=3252900 RepID=UPI003C30C6AF
MIRIAKLKDIDTIADLILLASSVLFEDILKTKNLKAQKALLLEYLETPDTKFYYKNILVYELDNKIVSALVFYEANDEAKLNENMEKIVNNGYKFDIEAYPNTIYLDSLAVDSAYRGKGISKELFLYAIDHADKDLSLLVETYKEDVEKYYERLGFKVVERVKLFNAELDSMVYHKNN